MRRKDIESHVAEVRKAFQHPDYSWFEREAKSRIPKSLRNLYACISHTQDIPGYIKGEGLRFPIDVQYFNPLNSKHGEFYYAHDHTYLVLGVNTDGYELLVQVDAGDNYLRVYLAGLREPNPQLWDFDDDVRLPENPTVSLMP